MTGVQSVERSFAILRCLAGGPAGVSEIADRVGLPKSTVSRLLSTLSTIGAVEQSGAGNDYRIGHGMVDLAAAAIPGRNLISVARPHLVELVETLGEAAGLAVLDVADVVYLDQVNVDNPVQVRDWTGERLHPHMVSSGLVLLAHLSDAERERYLARPLEAATPQTITDAAALRRRLEDVARRGTEWTIDEFVVGISSVAAPVTGAGGQVVAAVHAHGPSYRFPPPGAADEVAGQVAAAADRISARLATRPSV
jgi:IclR family transcriptional regulator, acetate operon repressor